MANTKLSLDDIVDLQAYEREREEFRTRIIHNPLIPDPGHLSATLFVDAFRHRIGGRRREPSQRP
ncbi:MAG: hypothetical protein M3Y91_18115 [Actinomycetota bacterium]|nr:hypothetical protein [Actinomycetota bacterium]